MRPIAIVLLVASLGCSSAMTTANDVTAPASTNVTDTTLTNGPLTLKVHDFATQVGILWALPSVQTAPSTITVQSTRYGSLCRIGVSGSATVAGKNVTLDITFTDRTSASCPSEIRALTYTATLAIAPGTYDVAVVHHENGSANTIVRRTVTVP